MENPYDSLFSKRPNTAHKPVKIPKKLGDAADLYYELRAARKWYKERAEHLTTQMGEVEKHLRAELDKQGLLAAKGKVGLFSVDEEYTQVPRPKDFPKFMKWVAANQAWDVLRKQVNAEAIRDRIAAGQRIPQLDFYEYRAHHSSKVGG